MPTPVQVWTLQGSPALKVALVGGELVSGYGVYLRSQHGYAPCVLAITGTNGKTTVTSLTGQLVERAGKTVAVAGNIGPTLLDTLAGHIDADTLPQAWVLELSSFQLDGVAGFEPTAATVLNDAVVNGKAPAEKSYAPTSIVDATNYKDVFDPISLANCSK